MKENKIKVSVCVTTYNQEQYIGECLESIVTQECDFDFEVIVGEDCSTDNTRAIVQEYAYRYPNIVKPIFHNKNVGGEANYFIVHNQAKGDYICIIDGDDYALPGKLQVQADFMDNNPKFNIIWHAVAVQDKNGMRESDYLPSKLYPKTGFRQGDILAIGSVGCHSSKMYRSELRNNVFNSSEIIDFYLDVKHIGNGYGGYINEIFGVYRKNIGVSFTQKGKIRQLLLNNLHSLSSQYPEHKLRIGSFALRLFIQDLIHRYPTLGLSWGLLNKNFSLRIIPEFIKISFILKYGKKIKDN